MVQERVCCHVLSRPRNTTYAARPVNRELHLSDGGSRRCPAHPGTTLLRVLSTRWQLARRFIDGGMAAGIGDPDVLALVVTRDGTILARAQGDPDDASWAVIAAALS